MLGAAPKGGLLVLSRVPPVDKIYSIGLTYWNEQPRRSTPLT